MLTTCHVSQVGFEPTIFALRGRYSTIKLLALSEPRMNRTFINRLKGGYFAVKLWVLKSAEAKNRT